MTSYDRGFVTYDCWSPAHCLPGPFCTQLRYLQERPVAQREQSQDRNQVHKRSFVPIEPSHRTFELQSIFRLKLSELSCLACERLCQSYKSVSRVLGLQMLASGGFYIILPTLRYDPEMIMRLPC
jgi:hypothetical protein